MMLNKLNFILKCNIKLKSVLQMENKVDNLMIIEHDNDKPTVLYYQDNVVSDNEVDFLFDLNYKEGVYDKENKNDAVKVSRKQLWYQTENKYFCPIWKKRLDRWEANSYPDKLLSVQNKIEELINNNFNFYIESPFKINSCLINYYETGNNFIPPHKDSSVSFGEYPTIICVSHGDERTIRIKNEKESYDFKLKSNSVFIMAGSSQKYYTHEILKKTSLSPRYSMTFRNYIL